MLTCARVIFAVSQCIVRCWWQRAALTPPSTPPQRSHNPQRHRRRRRRRAALAPRSGRSHSDRCLRVNCRVRRRCEGATMRRNNVRARTLQSGFQCVCVSLCLQFLIVFDAMGICWGRCRSIAIDAFGDNVAFGGEAAIHVVSCHTALHAPIHSAAADDGDAALDARHAARRTLRGEGQRGVTCVAFAASTASATALLRCAPQCPPRSPPDNRIHACRLLICPFSTPVHHALNLFPRTQSVPLRAVALRIVIFRCTTFASLLPPRRSAGAPPPPLWARHGTLRSRTTSESS